MTTEQDVGRMASPPGSSSLRSPEPVPVSASGNDPLREKPLLAFAVTEEDEGTGGIIFARHAIVARRLGANEYADGELGYVTCHRAPWADQFADTGEVPISVMVDAGWHFECGSCGSRIDSDMLWERDLILTDIIGTQNTVAYCNAVCEARDRLRRAESKYRQDRWMRRFRKIVKRRFPDAVLVPDDGNLSGNNAYVTKRNGRWIVEQVAVSFEFPGMAIAPATLRYERRDGQRRRPGASAPRPQKPYWSCCSGDREAFEAWARRDRDRRREASETAKTGSTEGKSPGRKASPHIAQVEQP